MRRKFLWLMAGLATIVAAAALSFGRGIAPANTASTAAPPPSPRSTPDDTAPRDPRQTAQVRSYWQHQQFTQDTQRFFREAASLGPAERALRAQAVERNIDAHEQAGELQAGEAVLLRASLIRATERDPQRQMERIQDLALRYRSHTEQRMEAWAQQQQADPQFQDYKQRERAVMAEVAAMTQIPGGLSRNQYLQQRLQHEREVAYGRR